ncbi:MAG TPA: carboxypeptidase-like regulatory domain-containing protein [Planctomycetota bacterium]
MRRVLRAGGIGLALVLLVVGLLYLWSSGARSNPTPSSVASAPAAEPAPARLRAPAAVEPEPVATRPRAREAEPERTARPASRAPRTRALVHGRLLIASSGAPLDEVLRLRLRTGDLSVIEELVSAPDGSFASTVEFPRGLLLLKVFRPNGDVAADIEGPFDPAAPEEWLVRVPWSTFVHATVLGREGQELPRLDVALFARRAGGGSHEGRTRKGEFTLDRLEPGPYTLHLSLGLEAHALELDVRRGPNELGELRVPLGEGGAVSGRLLAPGHDPVARLMLRAEGGGLVALSETSSGVEGEARFQIEGVPPGRYRLELLSEDGLRYEPGGLELKPPASGLEFHARGSQEPFRLQASDADGQPLDVEVLVRIRGQWILDTESFARADVERWIALAPEHRPARGERPAATPLEVRLERGHGEAFLFQPLGFDLYWANAGGVRGGVLAGVAVVADGRTVAESDADGLALVSLEAVPDLIELQRPGWRVIERIEMQRLTLVGMGPE